MSRGKGCLVKVLHVCVSDKVMGFALIAKRRKQHVAQELFALMPAGKGHLLVASPWTEPQEGGTPKVAS